MWCKIDGKMVDCKVVENLGFQGGVCAKIVLHNGKETVVIKNAGLWVTHVPVFIPPSGFTDPIC